MGSTESAGPAPCVLLTNDDGPSSPFFQQWLDHLRNDLRWECASVVPTAHCSVMSKALTKEPFKVERVGDAHWLAAAPPATCVNLGCFTLYPSTNFVIVGPDVGHNVGRAALLSSATIGAAMEAALAGHKAIAVSFSYYRRFGSWTPAELAAAIQLAAGLCKEYWESWPSDAVDVISINVPLGFRTNMPTPTPVVVCSPQPTSKHRKLYAPVQPGSSLHAWKPEEPSPPGMEEDVDVTHVMAGHATVTYLQARYAHVELQ